MIARLTADAVAAALVAAYQYDGKDPRELLGSAPSVTILADAALVIKERFHLRSAQAAGLCCLARRSRAVAIKMGDAFACRKRDRRQAFIKLALATITPPSDPSPVDLPPIPPVVCGRKWTRDYIGERERILALHRQAGRKAS